jgi:hypothetical protein
MSEHTASISAAAPYRSGLCRLATVELQLCMQGLDAVSLMILARCCRHLHAVADTPFAWRYTHCTLRLKSSDMELAASTPGFATSCVARHSPFLGLLWQQGDQPAPILGSPDSDDSEDWSANSSHLSAILPTEIPIVDSLRGLRALDSRARRVGTASLIKLFSNSQWSMQLRTIHIGMAWIDTMITSEVMQLLSALPHLSNLWLCHNESKFSLADPDLLAFLPSFPALTQFRWHDIVRADRRSLLEGITQCSKLKRLELVAVPQSVLLRSPISALAS